MSTQGLVIAVMLAGGACIVCTIVAYMYYGRIWFRAYSAGVPVPFLQLLNYTRRGLSPFKIVSAYVRAKEGGVLVSLAELEAGQAQGVDIRRIVQRMVDAKREGRPLNFEEAGESPGTDRSFIRTKTT